MNDEQRGLAPEPSPPVPAAPAVPSLDPSPIASPELAAETLAVPAPVAPAEPVAETLAVPAPVASAEPVAVPAAVASAEPVAVPAAVAAEALAPRDADPGPAPAAAPTDVAPPGPAAPAPFRADYRFLTVLTVISLVADLATKAWAKWRLSGVEPRAVTPRKVEVVKDHLDFVYALNPGGAWSFLRGLPELVRRPFFLFISAAAIVFIVSVYRRVRPEQRAMRWGLPLALGGAIGNLVDRIRYGSVIDFIDFYVKSGGQERHWPTYNVADVAIVVGVVLMAYDTMTARHDHAPAAAGSPAAPAAPAPPATDLAMPVPATPPPGPGAPAQP